MFRTHVSRFVFPLLLLGLLALFVFALPVQAATSPGVRAAPTAQDMGMGQLFLDAAVQGIPLTVVVFALVAFLKAQGVQGKTLLFSSLGSGLLLGAGYMVYKTRPPINDWWVIYGYWFGTGIYGLALGLLASGVYEGVRAGVASALKKLTTDQEQRAALMQRMGIPTIEKQ